MKTASIRAAGGTQGFANAVEMRGVENWQPACDHHGVPPYFKMNDARPHPPRSLSPSEGAESGLRESFRLACRIGLMAIHCSDQRSLIMNRRAVLGILGAGAAGLAGIADNRALADEPHAKHAEHFDRCAKACAECLQECDSCYHHCAGLVAEGHKDHARTMNLCVDCGEICSASARLAARQSVLAAIICEACAKACDECAAACGKFPNDKHMAKCATACRDCAAACRDMIKSI